MNVYTHLFIDTINWPFSVPSNKSPLPAGLPAGILWIPRVDTAIYFPGFEELRTFFYKFYTFIILNIDFFKNYIITRVEYNSIILYSKVANLIHASLLQEFECRLNSGWENKVYEPSYWLIYLTNSLLIITLGYLTLLYIYTYGIKNTSSCAGLTEGGIFLYAYLDEIEEECGQLEDFFSYIIYFSLFCLWFFIFYIFASAIILKYLNFILVLSCFVFTLGLLIPTTLLMQIGLAFPQFIRGSGKSTSLVFETLLDFVSVSVIIIRFFVQNIRFVFIFVGFFEYFEFIASKITPAETSILPHITWTDYWAGKYRKWYWFEILLQVFAQIILYLYYVGHFVITYIAQLSVYIALSFWMYFFLYTTFSLPSKEKYFFYKRYALLIK